MSKLETCPVCGKAEFTLHQESESITSPDGVRLPYEAEYSKCAHCGEEFFTRAQSRAASRAASAALRVHQGLLTPEEIIEIREKHGLTQDQLQEVLGLGKKTVVRWEAGTVNQSRAADLLLRQLRDGSELINMLLAARGGIPSPEAEASEKWAIPVTPVGGTVVVAVKVSEGRASVRRSPKQAAWKLRKIGSSRLAAASARALKDVKANKSGLLIKVG